MEAVKLTKRHEAKRHERDNAGMTIWRHEKDKMKTARSIKRSDVGFAERRMLRPMLLGRRRERQEKRAGGWCDRGRYGEQGKMEINEPLF